MSVDTTTTPGREHIGSPRVPRSVPVARVIAGSLVAGAVMALVLVLVVFPGATESVVTGSALLAFGLGWAMMRFLSARMTTQPQRWTTVPAVAMTAAGAGLLVFSPQDATLSTLTWVWPPAMLALVVWMFVQMRRALTGRGRWLLTPVLVDPGRSLPRRHRGERRRRSHREHLPGPREDLRGGRPPAAPVLPGHRRTHGRALQRHGRVLRVLGQDHRPGQRHRLGSAPTTAPGRAGATTSRAPRTGVTAARDLHAAAGRGRRARAVRARRALHRRPVRHDLRRDLPRAGRRHGAAGQLQPPPVHRSPRLPHPVRPDAARPGDPAHAGTRGPAAGHPLRLPAA